MKPPDVEIAELREQNKNLRECLQGTRNVIVTLRSRSPESLHRGFDLWLGRIDMVLDDGKQS